MSSSTLPLRIVRWTDSSLQNGQVDKYAFPKPETIVTVGFLVDETDEYVTVARDDMGNGDYRGLCCIPKVSVLPGEETKLACLYPLPDGRRCCECETCHA